MAALARVASISDLRRIARRRLPRAVFDFIDGGAEDESTLSSNERDLRSIAFVPRYLVDVTERSLGVDLLGKHAALPLIIAPTGMAALAFPNADVVIARAAHAAGIPFTISTSASVRMETIRQQVPDARLWFQLYYYRDHSIVRSLIGRARDAGIEALVVTIDVPLLGHRYRDVRNAFTVPLRPTARLIYDCIRCLPWSAGMLRHGLPRMQNLIDYGRGTGVTSLAALIAANLDPSLTWDRLAQLRDLWPGPLVIKGVMSAEDAKLAVTHGAQAVWVSNHGGRQLAGAASSVSVLESIVDAIAGRAEIYFDGGVRRGSDIARARALGATAAAVGRAPLYGVAAAGGAGAQHALSILRAEYDRCLALLGCNNTAHLHCGHLSRRCRPGCLASESSSSGDTAELPSFHGCVYPSLEV